MKKLILLIIIFTTFSVVNVEAQKYKIEVYLDGIRDSTLILAVHYGNNKYVVDTAVLDSKGKAVFSKNKSLDGGMYIIAMNGNQLFDFLISDSNSQNFSIQAKKNDYIGTLSFKNSPENEEFANFNRYMMNRQNQEEAIKSTIDNNLNNKDIRDAAMVKEDSILQNYNQYVAKIIEQYPGTLLANLAQSLKKPIVPNFEIDPNSPNASADHILKYYLFSKNHFFDNYNFSDKRILNTPIFAPALDYYFTSVVMQQPDSIINAADQLLIKAKPSPEITKFIAGQLFNKYASSKIMGMESIVIHLIDNYYLSGKIKLQDSAFIAQITDYANHNRLTLIGKVTPDLTMQSLNGQYESIHSVDAPYMLIYFFEPSCGVCKKETPKVYELYKKYRDKGFTVFAVYTQQDKEEWQSYVTQNGLDWINVWDPKNSSDFRHKYSIYSVPQAFLIDKNKKIVGRRIDAEGLDLLLENLFDKISK